MRRVLWSLIWVSTVCNMFYKKDVVWVMDFISVRHEYDINKSKSYNIRLNLS